MIGNAKVFKIILHITLYIVVAFLCDGIIGRLYTQGKETIRLQPSEGLPENCFKKICLSRKRESEIRFYYKYYLLQVFRFTKMKTAL